MRPLTPLFLTLALLLCSCRTSLPPSSSPASQEADQGSYRIGVSFPTTSLLFRSAMFQLLEEFDLSEGSVELILCDGENSQEKQNQDLVNLIDDPVDGIILIPYTMEGPLPAIQYANDRGIPVLTLDNRVESSPSPAPSDMWGLSTSPWGNRPPGCSSPLWRSIFLTPPSGT